MACYAYYVLDDPLISDQLFEHITSRLMDEWETLSHSHKHLITMDDLVAGTGFALTYPEMVQGAAKDMAWKHLKGQLK